MVDQLTSTLPLLLPLFLSLLPSSSSLQVTSSSPCQSICAASTVGTTVDEIVCLDNQFASTTNGTNFQQCVECELGSTAVDSSSGATDVAWGLYNLRYALSSCLFGFPIQKISISTPCQVSCEPLRGALGHSLNTNATLEDLSYCNFPGFQDTAGINRCAACYGRMESEAYMANFLQTLHIACLQPPRPSQAFPVAANTIFNSTPIATPTPSSTAAPGQRKPANLALVISLPVVFGVLILAGIIGCCFYSARHRRRIMAERNAMRRIQDKYSPTFPPNHPRYQDHLQVQSPQGFESAPAPEPVYFSPIADRKVDPYIQVLQQPPSSQQQFPTHPQQSTFPSYHRSYSPADYATHSSPNPLPPVMIDTSQIGPGPDQKQVHTLHDQYFPPPPPPPAPLEVVMPPPPPPPLPQEGVESLREHHMKTPSLGMPTPRGKKSLDVQRSGQQQAAGYVGDEKDAIPLQDYRPVEGGKDEVGGESPQVFVYDAVNDRYVKETN